MDVDKFLVALHKSSINIGESDGKESRDKHNIRGHRLVARNNRDTLGVYSRSPAHGGGTVCLYGHISCHYGAGVLFLGQTNGIPPAKVALTLGKVNEQGGLGANQKDAGQGDGYV